MQHDDLIVFVTELARRQYVRRQVVEQGFVDASRFLTFTRLRETCVHAARRAGLLAGREMTDVWRHVTTRRVAETAAVSFKTGVLSAMSLNALSDALEGLVDLLSPFGADAEHIHRWLLRQPAGGKLNQLGQLYSVYREICRTGNLVDTRDVNAAILELLSGDAGRWPHILSSLTGKLIFRSVRWLNPFEEQLTTVLKKRLGEDLVEIHSAVPPAHAEKMEDRLDARVRAEVMTGADEAWAGWAENLGDALEVDDSEVALASADRVSFSRSVSLYGEIEDLARRIRWEMEHLAVPPERIALVIRNLSDYSDAITNVFGRFGIPCFFRRGIPVSAAPLVKTLLSLLSLPLNMDRDRFCALLQSASIHWPGFDDLDERRQVAFDLLDAATPPRITAETVRHQLHAYYQEQRRPGDQSGLRIKAVAGIIAALREISLPATLSEHGDRARKLIRDLKLEDIILDKQLPLTVRVTNLRALEAVCEIIDQLADATSSDKDPHSLADFVGLLEKSIENATVSPGNAEEAGVWILNPFDAAGLQFDVVLIAGLNEGVFPAVPREDSLFGDEERKAVHDALGSGGIRLPHWALPLTTLRALQENVLFLITLGTARERLVLSYQACDTDGREKVPGDFFRSIWNLAGWPVGKKMTLNEYDQWRIAQLGEDSYLARHVATQAMAPRYQRTPMPGESYLATIPLPFCCAPDEARQRLASSAGTNEASGETGALDKTATAGAVSREAADLGRFIHALIDVERSREIFFETPAPERKAVEPYCGKLGSGEAKRIAAQWLKRHDEFSPTALEDLGKCRYRFLLSRIAYLGALRTHEDVPDPMDRGTIIHEILERAYATLRDGPSLSNPALRKYVDLCGARSWAFSDSAGRWHIARDRKPSTSKVLPLVTFDRADPSVYSDFAAAVADAVFESFEASAQVRLGDPGIWATEKPKIRQIVRNYLRLDAEGASEERRYPALFELKFGRQYDGGQPDCPALTLSGAKESVRVHGQIDRIDFLFDEHGVLSGLLVIDYKGPSRGKLTEEDYAEEIAQNLDCQLPVYGLVAQHFLFGRHNEPELNKMTEVVYHIQERELKEMERQFTKRRVHLDFLPEDKQPLTASFIQRLVENLLKLRQADFSVDPLDCNYCDFKHICRVDVNALEGAQRTA